MNRILSTLFSFVLVMGAVAVYAAAPTYLSVEGNYFMLEDKDDTVSTDAAFDTVAGATDSSRIFDNWRPKDGWDYVLAMSKRGGASCDGSGTDSCKLAVDVWCYDSNDSLLAKVAIDSLTACAGEFIRVPVGGTLFGDHFDIWLKSYTDNGGEVIIDEARMYRRAPVGFVAPDNNIRVK